MSLNLIRARNKFKKLNKLRNYFINKFKKLNNFFFFNLSLYIKIIFFLSFTLFIYLLYFIPKASLSFLVATLSSSSWVFQILMK
jgi:hypothetical protein